ncbi:hypothetical protein TWF225_010529 [Orbilia oligospora]|nr:hypothetical protein TWF225_010529 [Orbilia oligospora]KAF3256942.1 hypothetical protein TWF128_005097 [Orbilia oligospora]KAF3260322.1 hypothetical protein TWF217_004897 [Orbilia oligospora]
MKDGSDPEGYVDDLLIKARHEVEELYNVVGQPDIVEWTQPLSASGHKQARSLDQLSNIVEDICIKPTKSIMWYIDLTMKHPEQARKPFAVRIYKSVVTVLEESVARTLELCYRLHTSGKRYTPVIVQAWNDQHIGFRCPGCNAPFSKPYKEPPYLGYPLVYKLNLKCDCGDSSEPRYFQMIFSDIIHPLTLKGVPVALGEHWYWGLYWRTLNEEFTNEYFRPSREKPKGGDVDSLTESFSKLGFDEPMEFSQTEALRVLSEKIEKQMDILGRLRKIVGIFDTPIHALFLENNLSEDEQGPNGSSKWKKKWIYKMSTPGFPAKFLFETKTKFAGKNQTAGLLLTTDSGYSVIGFSGGNSDPLVILGDEAYSKSHGEKLDVREIFFDGKDINHRGGILSKLLKIEYKEDWSWEHYHVEKKLIVNYLHTHGIWYARDHEKNLRRVKRTPDHVIILYVSKKVCEGCQKFIRAVAKYFGLDIRWCITGQPVDVSFDSAANFVYGIDDINF